MIELIVKFGPTVGYLLIFAIIFAESGLLIGFFLPGDSVLFVAGFLASPTSKEFLEQILKTLGTQATIEGSFFSLPVLLIGCFLCAVAGDSVGYTFGRRIGPRLFQKEDSLLFSKKNVVKAEEFYEKYGGKAIVLARFLPVVRTFAPIVAGVGHMNYRRFLVFNLIGGILWAIGVTLAGYFLASVIGPENIDKYLLPIIVLIVAISIAPSAYHVLREKENRDAIRNGISKLLGRSAPAVDVE